MNGKNKIKLPNRTETYRNNALIQLKKISLLRKKKVNK